MVQLNDQQEKTIAEVMREYSEGHRANISVIVYWHPDWPAEAVIDHYESL